MIIDFNRYNGGGSASGVTPEQVQQQIDSALTPYWESGETKDYVDEAVSGLATEQYVQDALSGIDLSNYYTSAQTDTAIANAVSGLATEQYVQDALSGVDLTNYWTSAQTEDAIADELSAYWTSAETQDAIDEKTAKYFTKNAPIIRLDADNINAFFGEDTTIYLLDVTNGYYNDNQFDDDSTIYGEFIIDKAENEFYVENVPAGFYRIGIHTNNIDPTLTFKVWIDGEEIETNTTNDLPYAVDDWIAILSYGNDYKYANWSLDADAERITFKYDEETEEFHIEVIYKPTIDEVMSAYTPTSGFSTINGSAITNGGNITVADPDMSAYWTITQTKDAISAATADFINSGDVQTQIEGYNYVTSAQVETQIVEKNYVTSAQVETQITSKGYATVSQIPTVPTSNTAFTNDAGYITDTAIENFVTSAQVETQITSKGYATVSQIPTVPTSNTAFTNDAGYITSADTADMVTSTSVSTIWRGTQVQYDAIQVKDPNTFYIILLN